MRWANLKCVTIIAETYALRIRLNCALRSRLLVLVAISSVLLLCFECRSVIPRRWKGAMAQPIRIPPIIKLILLHPLGCIFV